MYRAENKIPPVKIVDPSKFVMPFGKYEGQFVADIPLQYIEWLIDNCDLREPLLSVIDARINGMPSIESVIQEMVATQSITPQEAEACKLVLARAREVGVEV